MRHIDYGIGIISARALTEFPADEPFDLAEVYRRLLSAGELIGFEVSERFYEIGSPEGLEETRAFLTGKPHPASNSRS
jgi:NDP-sugar pyrophosphorylase family protein